MIIHKVIVCSKQAQKKYNQGVINWELCKELKFDDSTKCYMHKPESALEKETLKIRKDFAIQTESRLEDQS